MSKLAAAGLSRTVAGPGAAGVAQGLTGERVGDAHGLLERRGAGRPGEAGGAERGLERGPLSPISTAATARSATTGGEAGQVDALVAAAGDQHDRRRRRRGAPR